MGRKPKDVLVEADGKLYINTRAAGISPLIAAIDQLPLFAFKENKRDQFMELDVVLAWHRKELQESNGSSGRQDVVDACVKIKEQQAAEQLSKQTAGAGK